MPERDAADLGEQLRSYVDGVSSPVGAERARVLGRRHVARRRRLAVGAIAAVAVAATGGALAVASTGSSNSQGPAGTTIATIPRTTTSCCSPITSATTTVPPTAPLTSVPTGPLPPRVATGTWSQLIATSDGVWAFANAQTTPGGSRVAFLDARTGRVIAEASGGDVSADWTGAAVASGGRDFLYGVVRGGAGATSTVIVFTVNKDSIDVDARVPVSEEPVAIAGNDHAVWVATAHSLRKLRGGNDTVSIGGAAIVDVSADPSGQRLYVAQFDAREQLLVSVRSAVDGHLLDAPKVVGSGPGPGRVVAAANGVWVTQPTGNMGFAQRFSPDLVAQGASIEGSNGVTVKVAGNVVLVDRTSTDDAVLCLDPNTAGELARVPGTPGELFATDGTRIYQSPFTGGIEVHDLPPSCRS
jgi:hypothetical protein